jgi:hypothetical protein
VTIALTLSCAPVGVFAHTYSPSRTLAIVRVLRIDLDEVLLLQLGEATGCCAVSSPPPSYSTSRPEVRTSGYSFEMSLFFSCTDL